ncbi:helix-turn-helix domain-containing protein [Chitinimonas arctica]|uniref:Helix-turn-helix domain-containing protein n=1 Tax=Chitinimonas arctica TaxID=2594795 RepID=A0A516SCU3_9NEIS|nr:helix-turn-helix domain-containing protein [Chitinimonas arctica]
MQTYTLEQAAALAQCHPETLRNKIKASEAPGRKVGRAYVILENDLAAYLRGEYVRPGQAAVGPKGTTTCPSTSKKIAVSGTSIFSIQAEKELDVLLGLPMKSPRRNSMIGSRATYGE